MYQLIGHTKVLMMIIGECHCDMGLNVCDIESEYWKKAVDLVSDYKAVVFPLLSLNLCCSEDFRNH